MNNPNKKDTIAFTEPKLQKKWWLYLDPSFFFGAVFRFLTPSFTLESFDVSTNCIFLFTEDIVFVAENRGNIIFLP